jgi:hypothetical protein
MLVRALIMWSCGDLNPRPLDVVVAEKRVDFVAGVRANMSGVDLAEPRGLWRRGPAKLVFT